VNPAKPAKAQQADENSAYVRALLWKRQPAFAAALAAAERSLSGPARPCPLCGAAPAADARVAGETNPDAAPRRMTGESSRSLARRT